MSQTPTDDMVEAARFTLSGICGFEVTAQAVRKALESALAVVPAPAEVSVGSEPVAEIVEATSPAAELIFGRDIRFFEALRTLPIGTKLYAAPHMVESEAAQVLRRFDVAEYLESYRYAPESDSDDADCVKPTEWEKGMLRDAIDDVIVQLSAAKVSPDQPEPDETWESWYHASWAMARDKVDNIISSARYEGDDLHQRILGALDDFANMYPEVEHLDRAALSASEAENG